MYWDEDDSSGHYKLLPNRRNKAIYYDNFGNRDTMDVNVDTLRWTTDEYSVVDSLGYFYNIHRCLCAKCQENPNKRLKDLPVDHSSPGSTRT